MGTIKTFKKDNTTLSIIKTSEPLVTEHEYKLGFLLQQKENILADKERCIAECDANILEVEELIAHCKEHGVVLETPTQSTPITKNALVEEIKALVLKELELLKEVEKPIVVEEPLVVIEQPKKKSLFRRIADWFK